MHWGRRNNKVLFLQRNRVTPNNNHHTTEVISNENKTKQNRIIEADRNGNKVEQSEFEQKSDS